MSDVKTQTAGGVMESPGGDYLPERAPSANHGRTGAGWTLFVGGSVGALIAGVGFILLALPVILVGVAVAAIGAVASGILRAAGFGQVERVRPQE